MKAKSGCTRYVILTKRYAIKIPQFKYTWQLFLKGLLANMQEILFSKMKDERMCPVLFYVPGGWLLIMPRCKEIEENKFDKIDLSKFWSNEKFVVPVENKIDSFGILDGKVVAIDYGS